MRFGIAKDIITPTHPMRLICSGGGFDKNFLSIHDDIYVRCLVLDDGIKKMVLISFDLALHARELNQTLAEYAQEKYGITSECFILACTHAHPVPAVKGYNPGSHDDEYEVLLIERAKCCLDRAICTMFEGTMSYTTFHAHFNISRRGKRDGVYRIAPTEDYPHDTEFMVFCIKDKKNDIRSIIMNYACHPVFYPSPRGLSGEFPARLCQLEDASHYGCVSMYFQSAAGDVRPRPTADIEKNCFNKMQFEDVDSFAKEMHCAVEECLEKGEWKEVKLSISAEEFGIELPIEPKDISYFEEYLVGKNIEERNPCVINAYQFVNGEYEKQPHTMTLHCQLVQLADSLFIATVGGEPCFGVKRAVKAALQNQNICFIGYTDSCAYLVDDRMLEEGGYEPDSFLEFGWIGPFKKGLDMAYEEAFSKAYGRIEK